MLLLAATGWMDAVRVTVLLLLAEEKGWWRGQLLRWACAAARLTEEFMIIGAILGQLQGRQGGWGASMAFDYSGHTEAYVARMQLRAADWRVD